MERAVRDGRGAACGAGVHGAARQVDMAPTLAVLLGLPLPAANQGRPLLEALDAPEAVPRPQALRNAVLQRRRSCGLRAILQS